MQGASRPELAQQRERVDGRPILDDAPVAQAADTLEMTPEQLAVVIDALGVGLWAQHMLHGSRAVPPDLYSNALALMVDGIAARTTVPGGTT